MNESHYADDLNRVLKYGAEDLHNLLSQIEADPAHQSAGSTLRLIAADAADEEGRADEARLLRSEHPIYFYQGKPHLARATPEQVRDFQNGHREAARFADSLNDAGHSMNDLELPDSAFDADTRKEMDADAAHFLHSYRHLIPEGNEEHAGHYFWMSRQGHGVGFRDFPHHYPDSADDLANAAHAAGEYYLDLGHGHQPDPWTPGEPFVYGYGGLHKDWGQKPGLPEQQ